MSIFELGISSVVISMFKKSNKHVYDRSRHSNNEI
jgi:hypothetical protein